MGQQYSHLSSEERILIEKLHCEQHPGIRRTAERIGRDKSTVSRELRRGLWFASNENGSYRPYRPKRLKTGPWTSGPFYSALAAQRKADRRRRESRKPRRMDSGPLRAWVLDALRRGWSPELIEGRLKAQYAGDPSMRISHECLYQWIYAKPQRALDLRQYLARGRKRRTRKKGRKAKGPRIPMRVPIADRPEAVGSRKGFGHFESDTVVGAAPSRRCVNTQVERRSRRLFARLVDDKSASATARAEYEIFKDMPPAARVDRTWDNGTEASLHMLVDEALGMLTYFADPYSSWQRGSNENRNGRIRRYLPKGTSFEDLTQDELDAIVGEINDEYDEKEETYIKIHTNTYIFEACTLLNDFIKIVDADPDSFKDIEGEADTLAGLILEIKGELPGKNDVITYQSHKFTILEVDNRRIKKIKYEKN